MASSFLKRKAEQRAKKADERYGAASYGGSASLRPSAAVPERVTNGGGNGAPVTRASNFLTKKAAERAGAIDQQFGTSAYGGSDWTVLDKEQGFNRWLEDMNDFSRRMSGDFAGREGAYQSKQSMDKYRSEAENNMEVMRGRANIYRSYFENNRDLYGDEAVESVLSALNQGEKYMGDLKGGLDSEYDFWSQFEDEKDYDHYKRGKEYAALSDAADFAEKSRYVSTYQPGTEKFNAWTGTYSNSGFGDINYDYINRNQTARDRQMLADIQSNASLLGLDSSERGEMTDDEIAIFNYIYATESPEAAYEYIDYLTSDLNYRQRSQGRGGMGRLRQGAPGRVLCVQCSGKPAQRPFLSGAVCRLHGGRGNRPERGLQQIQLYQQRHPQPGERHRGAELGRRGKLCLPDRHEHGRLLVQYRHHRR